MKNEKYGELKQLIMVSRVGLGFTYGSVDILYFPYISRFDVTFQTEK